MKEIKEKSFERRKELTKAAFIEFGDFGYEQASLNNILKNAEISKGTFYYHFKNKEGLYFYLIDILVEEKQKFFKENIKPEEYGKDIFSLLKTMSKVGMDFTKYKPEIYKFSCGFLKDMSNPISDKVKGKYDFQINSIFDGLIESAYQRGELRKDLPIKFIKNIISYLFINLDQITRTIDIDEYGEEVNYLIEFFKDGLGNKEY